MARVAPRVLVACLVVLITGSPALAQQPKRGGVIRMAEREKRW